MKAVILTLFVLLLPGTIMAKATLTLEGASADSTITIKYVVPVSSHVQVRITSSAGVHAAPQYGFQAPGNYTIILDKSGFFTDSYTASLILNRDREDVTRRTFLHSASGRLVTKTREEVDMFNRCYTTAWSDPKQAVDLWDEFLAKYPDYADRGLAFLLSIIARMSVTDSVDVHSAADSAAALMPHSGTYCTIGRILTRLDGLGEGTYPRTALTFADRALEQIRDVPAPYRFDTLYRYQHLRGHCLRLLRRFAEAEVAFGDAKKTLESRGKGGTYSDFPPSVWVFQGLALLHEEQGNHREALGFCENAVRCNPRDPELWMALQRNFNLFHGSDEGYLEFSRRLEAEIRGGASEKDDDLVGKPLPGFVLPRLGGGTLSLDDIKGSVSILNFWAFWCPPCMAELPAIARLASNTAASDVKVIAVHTPLGLTPGITKGGFPKIVQTGVSKYEGTFDTVWDTREQNLFVKLGIESLPVTMVADKAGIVQYRMVGFDPENAYRKLKAVVDSLNAL